MNFLRSALLVSIFSSMLVAAACSNTTVSTGNDGGPGDAGPDAGPDAGVDAGTDAGTDAGVDAGPIFVSDGGSPPAAPILSFTTSLGGVQLTWTLPNAFGDEVFQVYRADQGAPFVEVPGTAFVAADEYFDSIASALPGAGHIYEVTATNGNGVSPASNTVEVLQAPGDLVGAASDDRAILVWSNVQAAANYDVYRVPAADAGGDPLLIGNATDAELVDDGSTTPLTAGTTYFYQVRSKNPDGGQSSTGSNVVTAKAFGIDVIVNATHVSDLDASVTLSAVASSDPLVILGNTDAGTLQELVTFHNSIAAVVPDVPVGLYYIALPIAGSDPENFISFSGTTARSIDLSYAVQGRADAVVPTNLTGATALSYALTGLTPWVDNDGGVSDTLQSTSVGAGDYFDGIQTAIPDPSTDGGFLYASPGIPPGATTFSNFEAIDIFTGDPFLVDASKGDIYYLWQLSVLQSGQGFPYLSLDDGYTNPALIMTDGSDTPIATALLPPASTTVPDVVVKNTAFAAQQSAVNPASTNAGQTVSVYTEKDFSLYGNYTKPVTLAQVALDGTATGDVDVGSISYGNLFPDSWTPFVEVDYGFNTVFNLTGAAHTATFEAMSKFYQPLTGFDFTNITPPMAPVTNVKINGTLDAFTDEINVGLAPTISWSPPATGEVPNTYIVSIYELSLDSTNTVTVGNSATPVPPQDFSFTTTSTTFTFPKGVLTADSTTASHWYFITVDAQLATFGGVPIDQTVTLYKTGTSYASAQMISNKFTPQAGSHKPSSYRAPRPAGRSHN